MGRMNDDVRNLDPAVSIAVATTISLAAEALDRQFGCGQGAARLCMAQALAWQVSELAPHGSGPFFTAAVEMERARQAKARSEKGADRRYLKAVKAMMTAFDRLWTEAESQQARREGVMN